MHYNFSSICRPIPAPIVPAPSKKQKVDPKHKELLFANRVAEVMGRELLKANIDKYASLATLDMVSEIVKSCVNMTLEFVAQEQGREEHMRDVPASIAAAERVFNSLPSVGTLLSQRRAYVMRATPRCLQTGDNRKGAAFFAAHTLITILLQESTAVRQESIAFSNKLKTGCLYQQTPQVRSDVIHGGRFTHWREVCGKASASESDDLRICLHGWTDEFTPLDGLSQRARHHKYGVFLAALVNLPLHMRHYNDHILLLALYLARYAKQNSCLTRMLTGIGADGAKYEDQTNLRIELKLGEHHSPIIELPDDDKPGETKSWRLRIFLLLVSLDWLASGDFGPFAGSVSAKRPCPKCMWTPKCPCAWLSSRDPRRKTIKHSQDCKGCKPRTHEGVMKVVGELRHLESQPRCKGKAQEMRTATGIFSSHFASEGLLRDVVHDCTMDVMHIFFCGITRYLLSWVTDVIIPRDTTWEAVNANKRKHRCLRTTQS